MFAEVSEKDFSPCSIIKERDAQEGLSFPAPFFSCLGDSTSGHSVCSPKKLSATLTTEGSSRKGIQEGPGGY